MNLILHKNTLNKTELFRQTAREERNWICYLFFSSPRCSNDIGLTIKFDHHYSEGSRSDWYLNLRITPRAAAGREGLDKVAREHPPMRLHGLFKLTALLLLSPLFNEQTR